MVFIFWMIEDEEYPATKLMVFTSPPYYTVETYSHSNIFKNKQAWNTDFYIPLFSKTWLYLKNGGYYCLNVPIYLYNEICIPLWGKADKKIPLIKRKRSATHAYNEFIYIWIKK